MEWQGLRLNNQVLGLCESVQLANHFSTTHDDVRLPDLFSADEVRQMNNAKPIRLAEQSYGPVINRCHGILQLLY